MNMNHSNYPQNFDNSLKRSYIYDPHPLQHHPSHNLQRPSVLKRSSYTMNQSYQHHDQSIPKQSFSSQHESHTSQNQYCHQSNYNVNDSQHSHFSGSRLYSEENFDLKHQNKITSSIKQNFSAGENYGQRIKQITQKMQKITTLVDKHQQILKVSDIECGKNYWHNNLALKNVIEEQVSNQMKYKEKDWSIQNNLLKAQIQTIRKSIGDIPSRSQIREQMSKYEGNISQTITEISKNLLEQISQINKSRMKEFEKVRNEFEEKSLVLKLSLEEKIRKCEEESRTRKYDETEESSGSQVSIGKNESILLKITSQFIAFVGDRNVEISDNQIEYRIDCQGYLLDSQNRYLLNNRKEQIKLSSEQICKLKMQGFLN